MAEFTVNPTRLDPYKNFKFRVKWDNTYVAGVSKVSALKRSTDVIEHREGSGPSRPRLSPGQTSFEPVTIERGVTHDQAFESWANQVSNPEGGPGAEMALANFRKDIVIELHNEAGQIVIAYVVHRCWVSSYQALSDLQADGAGSAVEVITLQHEGWERDAAVVEPKEPSFS